MLDFVNKKTPIIKVKIPENSTSSPFFRKDDTDLIRMAVSNVIYETCLEDRNLFVDTSEIGNDTINIFLKDMMKSVSGQKIDSLSKKIHEKVRESVLINTKIITK
jgi:hypothetical protein